MEPWRSAGDVLRWWRSDVLHWTQQQAAERLNVRPSALSNWERGDRAISIALDDLDAALDGKRLLADLLWAQGTPDGLQAGRSWSRVFPGESRPVWVWVRSAARELAVEAEWGVARLEGQFTLGSNGLFITVGASLPDSPVVIQFSSPAWADFGSGELPADVPGAEVVTAIQLMQPSSARGALTDMFRSTLEAKVDSGAPGAADLAQTLPEAVDRYLGRSRDAPTRIEDWQPAPDGLDAVERERFARLRRARGLSFAELAARLRNQTNLDVGRDTLRRFEESVGRPHDPQLPVALDQALGAAGRLAVLDLRSGRGNGSIQFPPYLRGPFWVEFRGGERGEATSVVLRRGGFHREVELSGPRLVSAHWFDPSVPLRIAAPADVSWTVGVGRRAGAEAIDQGWSPTTMDVAQQAVAEIEDAIYGAIPPRPED